MRRVRSAGPRPTAPRPLTGHIAVVAGATRGAGRGIARALGEAGATVYCTGRSVRGNPSPYLRPETIDETADMINAAGGTAISVRVDHTVESEVEAFFARVDRDHGRLDVLVNCIAGEEPLIGQWGSFWKAQLDTADFGLRQSLVSHIITAKHAAPIMIRRRRGLIVEVTENDILSAGGNPLSQGGQAWAERAGAERSRSSGRMASRLWPSRRVSAIRIHAAEAWCYRRQLAGRWKTRPEFPRI